MTEMILSDLNDKGILTLTLNRPDVLNSLNRPLVDALLAALAHAAQDDAVRVIVLTGSGRGFCAGADLVDGQWPREEGWSAGDATAHAMEIGFNPLVRAIIHGSKPVITAINGIAAGGGVGLALCGDLVVAAQSAKFKLVFGPQLGIISDVGASWLVPQLIGRARANGLTMLGDSLDAKTAHEWGMVWDCVADDALMPTVMAYAERMADSAVGGLKAGTKAHDHALQTAFDAQLDYERDMQKHYCNQPEFAEGVKAFAQKRKPDFRALKK